MLINSYFGKIQLFLYYDGYQEFSVAKNELWIVRVRKSVGSTALDNWKKKKRELRTVYYWCVWNGRKLGRPDLFSIKWRMKQHEQITWKRLLTFFFVFLKKQNLGLRLDFLGRPSRNRLVKPFRQKGSEYLPQCHRKWWNQFLLLKNALSSLISAF